MPDSRLPPDVEAEGPPAEPSRADPPAPAQTHTPSRRERRRALRAARRARRESLRPIPDVEKGALPPAIPDDEWPKNAEKPPLALVVNLDGSAYVAVDPEREKELHAVQDVSAEDLERQQLEDLAERLRTSSVCCLEPRTGTLVCIGLCASLVGIGIAVLYLFVGGTPRRCRGRACAQATASGGARRLLMGGDGDGGAAEALFAAGDGDHVATLRRAMLGDGAEGVL